MCPPPPAPTPPTDRTRAQAAFYELDGHTLKQIIDNADYKAACTKTSALRTPEDCRVLQTRTPALSIQFGEAAHLELCRVMRYRKVLANEILVRRGAPATCLHLLCTGRAATYTTDPVQSEYFSSVRPATGPSGGEAFRALTPSQSIGPGGIIGEAELLMSAAEARHRATAVAQEVVELMEIDRADYDRIARKDGQNKKGLVQIVDIVSGLREIQGRSITFIHRLAAVATVRSFTKGQLCLAHPAHPALGSASASTAHVCILLSGEV